jgi:hypothetical protein
MTIPGPSLPSPPADRVPAVLARVRLALLLLVVAGIIGTAIELLLIGHYEDPWQLVPLVLFGLGLGVLAWQVTRPGTRSLIALRVVMALYVASGAVGTLLHYLGNVEFERERTAGIGGLALFREAMTGATPALAPGTMMLLGALGLLYAFTTRADPAA